MGSRFQTVASPVGPRAQSRTVPAACMSHFPSATYVYSSCILSVIPPYHKPQSSNTTTPTTTRNPPKNVPNLHPRLAHHPPPRTPPRHPHLPHPHLTRLPFIIHRRASSLPL